MASAWFMIRQKEEWPQKTCSKQELDNGMTVRGPRWPTLVPEKRELELG